MIKVENLVKKYAGVNAVKGISFDVDKGEIVGFLGPNGAGKSTTMRVLSCYLPPTSGQISVAGFDVVSESLKVRQKIGYLPESVPLYTDMRVNEYLRYRAALKGVPSRKIRGAVEEAMKLTDISDVQKRIVGQLSKGFRQRVGLADAILHEPELLILDEPTIGLDPNQIRHVRSLIANLSKKHTILLSTHILSEVEMLCTRVIILNKGKIEASDTPANLQKNLLGGSLINIIMKGPVDEIKKTLISLENVREVEVKINNELVEVSLWTGKNVDIREKIFDMVVEKKWKLLELNMPKRSLEEVFVQVTHHEE
ncbi:MAG: ATP-binding cassette domain-containing protein [Verrucomicrobiota bacterium]|nr:ATP-binding cassette domain-containing protein [Verrucomicrobiota bacterium]